MTLPSDLVGPLVGGAILDSVLGWNHHGVGQRSLSKLRSEDGAANSPLAIGSGEDLTENHADPHSAKFKAKWYELDIGWVYLRLLSIFGLAEISYARR